MRRNKEQGTLSNLILFFKNNWKKYALHFLIAFFLLFKIISLFKYHFPIWDEAVYLSMGKYIYSLGQSGYFEILRPIFFPLLIGIFWKLNLDYILFAELLSILIGVGTIILTYIITKKEFNENIALISAFLLALTPMFFLYTSYILVDIPSMFFVLICFYFIQKEKYYLAGLFAGISFLTRFPQALFVFAFGLFILHKMVLEKKFKKHFINALKFGIIFLLLISSFFIFNYFMYQHETGRWEHAAFRPLIFSVNNIYDSGKEALPFYFYFENLVLHNPFLILALLGLFFYFKDKIFFKRPLLFYSLLMFSLYYSLTGHKELRYALSFLPFVVIFASFGLNKLYNLEITKLKIFNFNFKKCLFNVFKISLIVIFIIISLFLLSVIKTEFNYRSHDKPDMVKNYYEYFKFRPIDGSIITTDPLVGYYMDNKVYAGYESLSLFRQHLKNVDYSAVFFDVEEFGCGDNEYCNEQVKEFVKFLLTNNLIYEGQYHGRFKYIFTTKNYFENLPKEDIQIRFGLDEEVLLSRFPNDTLIVSLILEDFPSLDDDFENIWFEENYNYFFDFFQSINKPVNLAIIPTHLEQLNKINSSEINRLKNSNFYFIQNGFTHTNELTLNYDRQKEKLKLGQEIIYDLLDERVTAFIPPGYSSNRYTPEILENLEFNIYISNLGDTTNVNFNRFDQKLTPITNWANKEYLSEEHLQRNILHSKRFDPFLLFSLYYFMFNEDNIDYIKTIYNHTKDYFWLSIYDLNEWIDFISNVNLLVEGYKITIGTQYQGKFLDNLTLLFYSSGNYEIVYPNDSINIKNVADDDIEICILNICKEIKSNEIVKFNLI